MAPRYTRRAVLAGAGTIVVGGTVGGGAVGQSRAASRRPGDESRRSAVGDGRTPNKTTTPTPTPERTDRSTPPFDCSMVSPEARRDVPECTPTPSSDPGRWTALLRPLLVFAVLSAVGLAAVGVVLARWWLAPDGGDEAT